LDTSESRRKEFRKIYEHLCDKPRFRPHHVSKDLGLRPSSVAKRLKEAIENGYIVGPQIRKKSFSNFKTYMYLVNSSNSLQSFREYIKNGHVLYHEMMQGFCNIRVVSDVKLDIDGAILEGVSSDYYFSYPPDQSWETSINKMWDMVRKFDPRDYNPKGHITTHWDETVAWSEQDETLFLEFKPNLRKPLQPLSEKTGILMGKIKDFLENLPEYCIISTSYFPLTMNAYDPYLYVFETDYEDFVIDLFSQLHATCWFQKVSNTLIAYTWIIREPIKMVNTRMDDVPEMQIPLLMEALMKKGIVRKENYAYRRFYWRKEPDDI
jgi:DNA-binding Lrp family transcriptional regulator